MILSTFVNFIKAFIFGVVEGITEWLPISSTGHLILLEEILKVKNGFSSSFWSLFLVVIQLGAIIAVVICYFTKLWPFGKSKTKEEKTSIWKLWLNVLIACIPAAIIGLLLDDWLDKHFYNFITVSITLIIYGILFILLEIRNSKRSFTVTNTKDITIRTALIIGCIQLLALIPGTSRSGVTILGAMLIGLDRQTSAEFSFFLSIPVMFGASLLKVVKFIMDDIAISSSEIIFLGVGCLVAFITSILVIKLLMKYIKKHDFKVFGIYRIVLGIVLILYYLLAL